MEISYFCIMKKYNNNIIKVNADSEMIIPNRKEYINTATKIQLIADLEKYINFLEKKYNHNRKV